MSQPANQAQTPANSAVQNTTGKGSKQIPDNNPGKRRTKKRRPSPVTASRGTRPLQNASAFSRLRHEGEKPTRRRSPENVTVFTRLDPRDKNVFTRLRERKRSVHSRLGPDLTPRHRHASKRRSASLSRSAEDPHRKRKEARDLFQSYVTCSSKRQRAIEEEWDAADRASRRPPGRAEELYLSKKYHDQGGH
ncbi:hypothetical protein Tco_1081657 [Tanacetum coccineum]|uniref:Uncharacterized protein n=1 Tax=Tanacetum coccineum TaxID=301880 RepID=A0ABQ5I097_9ASTR